MLVTDPHLFSFFKNKSLKRFNRRSQIDTLINLPQSFGSPYEVNTCHENNPSFNCFWCRWFATATSLRIDSCSSLARSLFSTAFSLFWLISLIARPNLRPLNSFLPPNAGSRTTPNYLRSRLHRRPACPFAL
jgi:hypothetical protein